MFDYVPNFLINNDLILKNYIKNQSKLSIIQQQTVLN